MKACGWPVCATIERPLPPCAVTETKKIMTEINGRTNKKFLDGLHYWSWISFLTPCTSTILPPLHFARAIHLSSIWHLSEHCFIPTFRFMAWNTWDFFLVRTAMATAKRVRGFARYLGGKCARDGSRMDRFCLAPIHFSSFLLFPAYQHCTNKALDIS